MNKIRLATVFSGIGAIEFALKRLGIETDHIFACDNGERDIVYSKEEELAKIKKMKKFEDKNKYVRELYESKTRKHNFVEDSYLANYNIERNRFFQDICLLDGTDFKDEVDLFVGGSPCQSFSIVGKQKGLEDTRGTLFYEYARLIKEIQPKVFIYENVKNMINHDKGKTWEVIQKTFDDLGYNYSFEILNACDFGIPQKRNRLFVVGIKKELNIIPNIPKQKLKCKKRTMQKFLLDNCSYGNFGYYKNGNIKTKKSIGVINDRFYLSPAVKKYVLKSGTKNWHQKVETDLPIARTLLKTMGNCHRAGVDNYITYKNGNIRMLTDREAHRLMGFTDDYKIVVSTAQAYKQAGNSIVVDVLMEIIKELLKLKVF